MVKVFHSYCTVYSVYIHVCTLSMIVTYMNALQCTTVGVMSSFRMLRFIIHRCIGAHVSERQAAAVKTFVGFSLKPLRCRDPVLH